MFDERAESPAGKIIGMAVGAIILGTVGWTGLQQIFAANTTGVDATVITLGTTVVGIVIAIGFMILFLKEAGLKIK